MSLKNNRFIEVIRLKLINVGPMKIGDGDDSVLIDTTSNKPYLPGTSVAGAIKAYLKQEDKNLSDKLFGNGDNESNIFVSDSYAFNQKEIEFRPGVSINSKLGVNNNFFERELLGAGHEFNLDLKIYGKDRSEIDGYLKLINIAFNGIESGELRFGSNKSNGSGVFTINSFEKCSLDMENKTDFIKYISDDLDFTNERLVKDLRLNTTVKFTIKGKTKTPLLVNGNYGLDYKEPDGKNIKNSKGEYIIPGSSFKGALRNAFDKIARYKCLGEFTDKAFGDANGKTVVSEAEKKSGKIYVEDIIIKNSIDDSTYNRIKIDKFTGGVRSGALMNDIPIKGDFESSIFFKVTDNEEENKKIIALMLFTLKDALTGEVSFGSGKAIGRGKLRGDYITIDINGERLRLDLIGKDHKNIEKIQELISSIN